MHDWTLFDHQENVLDFTRFSKLYLMNNTNLLVMGQMLTHPLILGKSISQLIGLV